MAIIEEQIDVYEIQTRMKNKESNPEAVTSDKWNVVEDPEYLQNASDDDYFLM